MTTKTSDLGSTQKPYDAGHPNSFSDSVSQREFEHSSSAPYAELENENTLPIIEWLGFAWLGKYTIIALTFLMLVIATLFVIALKYTTTTNVYEYPISFTFEGANTQTYPNGVAFRLNDLKSPAVLDAVYKKHDLAKYDVEPNNFSGMVSISAYAQNRNAIIQKYNILFNDKKSNLAEAQENQRQMSLELEAASNSAALIKLNTAGTDIPQEIAKIITKDIASIWSDIAINQRNILKNDIKTIDKAAFDPEEILKNTKLGAIKTTAKRVTQLNNMLTQIQSFPGSSLFVDSQTKMKISDIQNEISLNTLNVRDLASSWAAQAWNESEASQIGFKLYSGRSFANEDLNNLDYLIALDRLDSYIRALRKNLTLISAEALGANTKDPKTGLSTFEIETILKEQIEFEVEALRAPIFQLGISKNLNLLSIHYNSVLSKLKRQKSALNQTAQILKDAFESHGANLKSNRATIQNPSSTVIPQFDSGFIDRLIQLSDQGNNIEFKKELTRELVEVSKDGVEIDKSIKRIEEYLAIAIQYRDNKQSSTTNSASDSAEIEELIIKRIAAINQLIIDYADTTIRIAQRLEFAKNAFESIEAIDENENYPLNYYLRANKVSDTLAQDTFTNYAELADASLRIAQSINEQQYGNTVTLFKSNSFAEFIEPKIFTTRALLLIAMLTMLAFLAAIIMVVINHIRRTNTHKA